MPLWDIGEMCYSACRFKWMVFDYMSFCGWKWWMYERHKKISCDTMHVEFSWVEAVGGSYEISSSGAANVIRIIRTDFFIHSFVS